MLPYGLRFSRTGGLGFLRLEHQATRARDDKTDGCRILVGDSVDASGAALHINALFCDFYWSVG